MLHQSKAGQGGWERISPIPNPGVFPNNDMSEKTCNLQYLCIDPKSFFQSVAVLPHSQ